jgi:hypothetical protein
MTETSAVAVIVRERRTRTAIQVPKDISDTVGWRNLALFLSESWQLVERKVQGDAQTPGRRLFGVAIPSMGISFAPPGSWLLQQGDCIAWLEPAEFERTYEITGSPAPVPYL